MYDEILVPTDGSECGEKASEHALDLAEKFDALVHVVHVIDSSEFLDGHMRKHIVEEYMDDSANIAEDIASLARDRDLEVTVENLVGVPYEALLDYTEQKGVDLVVMGTHGNSGLGRTLVGGTTEKLVRLSEAPVITVGPEQ